MGVIEVMKLKRFAAKRAAHLTLKGKVESELKRYEAVLLCQRSIGGHKYMAATGMPEAEVMALIPKQQAWLRAKLVRLSALELVLVMHPRIARYIERWTDEVLVMPVLDKSKGK